MDSAPHCKIAGTSTACAAEHKGKLKRQAGAIAIRILTGRSRLAGFMMRILRMIVISFLAGTIRGVKAAKSRLRPNSQYIWFLDNP
jgi:hypothetical protein